MARVPFGAGSSPLASAVQARPWEVNLQAFTILGKHHEDGTDLDASKAAALLPARLRLSIVPLIESLGELSASTPSGSLLAHPLLHFC